MKFQAIHSSAIFQQVLRLRPCAKTFHFALHHGSSTYQSSKDDNSKELATSVASVIHQDLKRVDKFVNNFDNKMNMISGQAPIGTLCDPFLGLVVPKRYAHRAVTRNLIKRQIRAVFDAYLSASSASAQTMAIPSTPKNLSDVWVVRLRAGFDAQQFPSASSNALRVALRTELQKLFQIASDTGLQVM